MAKKTPTALGGRGMEKLAGTSIPANSTLDLQAQFIAARYRIAPELASTVAGLAFGSIYHG